MSTVDGKIKQYENKFKELKTAFEERAILQTAITVSRIMDDFENLGELFYVLPFNCRLILTPAM